MILFFHKKNCFSVNNVFVPCFRIDTWIWNWCFTFFNIWWAFNSQAAKWRIHGEPATELYSFVLVVIWKLIMCRLNISQMLPLHPWGIFFIVGHFGFFLSKNCFFFFFFFITNSGSSSPKGHQRSNLGTLSKIIYILIS